MELEELLVKKAIAGDNDAFRKIVEQYQALIFAICFNITRDKQEAENLAQETFLQVYRSLPRYEFKGFKTWIGRIATNKAIDWKRKMQSQAAGQIVFLEDIEELSSNEADSLDEKLLKKETGEKIISICEQLPEIYSVVIQKYYVQQKSYQQISNEEQISIKTVESRLYRAKQAIRKKWEEEGYETL